MTPDLQKLLDECEIAAVWIKHWGCEADEQAVRKTIAALREAVGGLEWYGACNHAKHCAGNVGMHISQTAVLDHGEYAQGVIERINAIAACGEYKQREDKRND